MRSYFAALFSRQRVRSPAGRSGSGARFWRLILGLLLLGFLLGRSSLPPGDRLERIRFYTRAMEFDFVEWTLKAFGVKLEQAVLGTATYLPLSSEPDLVLSYLQALVEIGSLEYQVSTLYTDPAVADAFQASEPLRLRLAELNRERKRLEPVAETILQDQLGVVAAEASLTLGGQTIPPALYHTTPPPHSLIVSPRQVIQQDFSVSISPGLSLEEIVLLENQVDRALDVSSLVVNVGGIGLYPTMVMETTDINWLAEVIAHEWIHNYLTLRPLGLLYLESPALRTMNETTASIAGKELGRMLIERYYAEFLPPPPVAAPETSPSVEPQEPPAFDFRLEMRKTRIQVDALLEKGQVTEAEAYMEARRQFFWQNGYRLRKINQAYFAFYGAYADEPGGGAAGADPVGAAVRLLRQQSPSLRSFLQRIAWLYSFEQLEQQVTAQEGG